VCSEWFYSLKCAIAHAEIAMISVTRVSKSINGAEAAITMIAMAV